MSKMQTSKNPKTFIRGYKTVKKSYDYRDLAVAIDAKDQQAAEQSASPELVEILQSTYKHLSVGESADLALGTCGLNLCKKAEGLFNGYAKDLDGQVVEKFDDQTIEMIAKNLELKNLVPYMPEQSAPAHPDEAQDRQVAIDVASSIVSHAHDRIDAIQEQLDEGAPKKKFLRIKFGDFELELKKAVHEFVNNFKKTQEVDKVDIAKAIKSWKRNMSKSMHLGSDVDAARELVDNWELHKESFNQILFAIQQLQK